ncbi:DNA glycosylase [Pelagophyceae sp. CCMP2097]|nr:DNA glycosylase [Pelagophyceae sp. CCMP2097]
MVVALSTPWQRLGVGALELRLAHTLPNGQSFCWDWDAPQSEWRGCLGDAALALREASRRAPGSQAPEWRCAEDRADDVRARLRDYCQLEAPLEPLYADWARSDARLAHIAPCLPGVRVLRQDPLECLISFICSSNNNIARITLMLKRLREAYGVELTLPPPLGAAGEPAALFPSLAALCAVEEQALRDMGFGYRAPYVVETCRLVAERGGSPWLASLRGASRREAREALVELRGVGFKVADCVALFSLDQPGAIPVDTHVWRIARRDFADEQIQKCASVTPAIYDRVGDLFRDRFGANAGWAHSLLFAAELPLFAGALPDFILAEQKAFKDVEKRANAEAKTAKRGRVEVRPPARQRPVRE